MGNGEFVDWEFMREHVEKVDKGLNRITTLEAEMEQVRETQREDRADIKTLQRTVWKATGMAVAAISVIVFIIEMVVRSLH